MGRARGFYQAVFNSASLTGSYQDFGVDLTDECIELHLNNKSDVDALISRAGTADDIRLAAGSTLSLTGSVPKKEKVLIAKGTQMQIKQVTAAGTGNIYMNCVLEG